MRIYIAGPYTIGDVGRNIRAAVMAGDRLLRAGHWPYIPHLNHLWHLVRPHDYQTWLALDLQYLVLCDAVLLLPGESKGAELETTFARQKGIPVYTRYEDVPKHE